MFERGDGTNQIALVSVADGAARILKSLAWRYPESLSFSSDGRYVAYTLPAGRDSGQHDVFLLEIDGSREPSLVERRYSVAVSSQNAGPLSEDQEVIHVLNRLGFGPRVGDTERVKAMGVDAYIAEQLHPERIPDPIVEAKLSDFTSLKMSSEELTALADSLMPVPQVEVRARVFELRRMAERTTASDTASPINMETFRRMAAKAPQAGTEVRVARLVRAVYSERQLQEKMVDFWMNHFNVNFGNNIEEAREAGPLAADFEQNVIRPRTLGKFEDLLRAVATHPAMLSYLDNRLSTAPADVIKARVGRTQADTGRPRVRGSARTEAISRAGPAA